MESLKTRVVCADDIASLRKLLSYQNLIMFPENEEILVAEKDGEILGAVCAGKKKVRYISKSGKFWKLKKVETKAWIFRLFVREDQRSRGIAKQLVKSMVAHLCKKRIKTMYAGMAAGEFKEIVRKVFLATNFTEVGYCVCLRNFCIGTLMKLQL